MPNLVEVTYAQTGSSLMGMREMQARAFAARDAQYLLLKAPPASGKSRALMFLALGKLFNQGLKKVIVAVPERSIAASFATTPLTEHGFFADWDYDPKYNLCTPGGDTSKVQSFKTFLEDNRATILFAPMLRCALLLRRWMHPHSMIRYWRLMNFIMSLPMRIIVWAR